jgi:hypothetical protein
MRRRILVLFGIMVTGVVGCNSQSTPPESQSQANTDEQAPLPAAAAAFKVPLSTRASFYRWTPTVEDSQSLAARFPTPHGFERIHAAENSFAEWLRYLPLKSGIPPVLLYNGQPKRNQTAHCAVVDMDVGTRDLQQCADALMRLRAEYLFSQKRTKEIAFHFNNGAMASYDKWAAGSRPKIAGSKVTWIQSAIADDSYANFRSYLDTVFAYAGTASLSKELKPVASVSKIQIGDVFIKGGSPGHCVMVVDVATDPKTQKRIFMLAQSYMPAQNVQILKNPIDEKLSPWYRADFVKNLQTPEWTFDKSQLKRFE